MRIAFIGEEGRVLALRGIFGRGKRTFSGKGQKSRKESLQVLKTSLLHSFSEKGSKESDRARDQLIATLAVSHVDLFHPNVVLRESF